MAEMLTITVSDETKKRLEAVKRPGESIDGAVARLLNEGEET